MAKAPDTGNVVTRMVENTGRTVVNGVEEVGVWTMMLVESVFWMFAGRAYKQPVRFDSIFVQMMEVGVKAIPIIGVMGAAIGVMLAIQGIYSLSIFGAESQVTLGIAFSVVREFAPMITGILVAGRSGSALAARIGTMKINQEIDALHVMGINPVRFLVAPALIAMVIMVPALTFFSNIVSLFAAGLYVRADLGISLSAYGFQLMDVLRAGDVVHGIVKSAIFAVLICLIGVVNGASVRGGAEGVGKVTTRSVVQAISAIIVTDMVFAFAATR